MVRGVRLPQLDSIRATGVTGLAAHRETLLLVAQRHEPVVFKLDSQLRTLATWQLPARAGAHSILIDTDRILVAATRLDQLLQLNADGSHDVVRDFSGSGTDTVHLNSIAKNLGRIYYSCFGPREGTLWSSARSGLVQRLDSDEPLLSGLHHPHSLCFYQGDAFCCESARGRVVSQCRGILDVGGYVRGLWLDNESLAIGQSGARKTSSSTGLELNPAEVCRSRTGSAVSFFCWNGESLSSAQKRGEISLSSLGREIYDVIPWPHQ